MSTVTCHTADCENEGVGIEMQLEVPDPFTGEPTTITNVFCGACSQPITDIDPPTP